MGWSGPARSGSYSGPGPTSPFCSAWPRLGLAAEIDKGVAILDYALDDRPSTGKGEVGGRLFPQRARGPLVPGELSGGKGLAATTPLAAVFSRT